MEFMDQHFEVDRIPRFRIGRLVRMAGEAQFYRPPGTAMAFQRIMAALAGVRRHLLMANTGRPARWDEHINIVGNRDPVIFVGIDSCHRSQLRVGRRT